MTSSPRPLPAAEPAAWLKRCCQIGFPFQARQQIFVIHGHRRGVSARILQTSILVSKNPRSEFGAPKVWRILALRRRRLRPNATAWSATSPQMPRRGRRLRPNATAWSATSPECCGVSAIWSTLTFGRRRNRWWSEVLLGSIDRMTRRRGRNRRERGERGRSRGGRGTPAGHGGAVREGKGRKRGGGASSSEEAGATRNCMRRGSARQAGERRGAAEAPTTPESHKPQPSGAPV